MLRHVAGADAFIDHSEWAALIKAVLDSTDAEDSLVKALMQDLSDELDTPAPRVDGTSEAPLAALRASAVLLDTMPDGGRAYRETLMKLGASIAESSGAQVTLKYAANLSKPQWVRGEGTSAVEREALNAAGEALGVS
jgi:hypothetical protein